MKKCIITALAATAVISGAFAADHKRLGYVDGALESEKSKSWQVRESDLSAQEIGYFGSMRKMVIETEWVAFAQSSKEKIIKAIEAAGWTIEFDMGTKPTVGFEFQTILRASKQKQILQIHTVVFPSRDGIADFAFFEQQTQ